MITAGMLPIATGTATLTPTADTAPVKIYVKKPRGTLYWGGAGLDGGYIQPQLAAFRAAGISHVWVGLSNSATQNLSFLGKEAQHVGTMVDAVRAGLFIRHEDTGVWTITTGMDAPASQFNLIGYSYGSLLAAQTAWSYARQGHVIDHLVLIGSPIAADFLTKLQSHKNIRKVIVINLTEHGDPLYAGISEFDLYTTAPKLGQQMFAGKGEGHFYYAAVVADSPRRWKELAQRIFNEGLR